MECSCVTHWVQKPKSLNLSLCVVQPPVDEDALVQSTHTLGVCLQSLLVTIKCHLRTVLWINANMKHLNRTNLSSQACNGSMSSLYLCFKYTPLSWNRLLTECVCVRLVSWEPTGTKLSVGQRAPLSSGPRSTSLQLCETHRDANHTNTGSLLIHLSSSFTLIREVFLQLLKTIRILLHYFWPWAIKVQMSNSSKRCLGSIAGRGTAGSFPQCFCLCSFPSPAENASLKEKSSSYPTTQRKTPLLPQHTHCSPYIILRHDNTKVGTHKRVYPIIVYVDMCCNTPNTGCRQQCTWYSCMVFSWQLASHTAHCRPTTHCTEGVSAVLLADSRTDFQSSDASGSAPVIWRTTVNESNNRGRVQHCAGQLDIPKVFTQWK